jgi:molybdenum cofactor guanylyltransferase/molybdopterin-guanine dinucleotide biosynthesis protein MobB
MTAGAIAGVLLAGGRSQRMGGGDKALRDLAGQPLIQHAIARLQPQVASLVLSANGDPARFANFGLPVVADEAEEFQGPLAGILAALHFCAKADPRVRLVASVSTDAPFVPGDLVAKLRDALDAEPRSRVAVACSRGRRHHVIGLWKIAAADEIAAALAHGERRAETLVDRLGAVSVTFPDAVVGGRPVDPFFNINTPDDLAFADAVLAEGALPTQALQVPPLLTSPTRGEGLRGEFFKGRAGERPVPFVVGVAGWKNSGKTTLVARLVADLVARGYRVATVKHTHHDISPDETGTDSARHRAAGAHEVALVSPRRWTLNGIVRDEDEPPLAAVVAALGPADIVIVEGYKQAAIPKIEVRRSGQGEGAPLANRDPLVFAIASDTAIDGGVDFFALDDVAGIAAALLAKAFARGLS